jgi:hypothetical protein
MDLKPVAMATALKKLLKAFLSRGNPALRSIKRALYFFYFSLLSSLLPQCTKAAIATAAIT